jgi:GcrA cell cycle regulator
MRSTNAITAAKANPELVAQLVEEVQIPEEQRRTILTLTESTCRWPIGDPARGQFYFCGGASEIGQPYCEQHSKIATQPAQSRRKPAANVPTLSIAGSVR